jgi:hypothetical protein
MHIILGLCVRSSQSGCRTATRSDTTDIVNSAERNIFKYMFNVSMVQACSSGPRGTIASTRACKP